MARERDRRDAEGFLAPGWLPGEARVDFGEADLGVRGVLTRGKYLTVTFPHSNAGPLSSVLANEKMSLAASIAIHFTVASEPQYRRVGSYGGTRS
jgi:hypothetical protein